jgi:hypothetical protein
LLLLLCFRCFAEPFFRFRASPGAMVVVFQPVKPTLLVVVDDSQLVFLLALLKTSKRLVVEQRDVM